MHSPLGSYARTVLCGALLAAPAGCARAPLHPYRFAVAPERASERTMALIAATMRAQGCEPSLTDQKAGLLVTRWADSGYRWTEAPAEEPFDVLVEHVVYRRYVARMVPDHDKGSAVQLSVETRRCLPDAVVDGDVIRGKCADLTRPFPAFQREVDDLGSKLQQALTTVATDAAGAQRAQVSQRD